ncbi:MAG TPA: outer membrane beta-barrel domain-containing protein [Polyangiaceae bacterium]
MPADPAPAAGADPALAAANPPAAGAPGAAPAAAGAPAAGASTDVELDAPAAGTPAPADTAAPPSEGDLGDICKIDPTSCPTVNLQEEAKKSLNEQMYAVQQIYALRYHRFEIQPAWNFSLNDQFVGHIGPVLALNFYVTNVLAVGINGGYYFNNDSTFNAETRRAARVAVPLTEYLWQAALNFTYVPMYGKFAGFGDFIFHYDAYVVGGVGAITTRPIAVVDPDNRSFPWGSPKVAFNAGLGLRIFFNRWFAAVLEVRDYIFLDKLENTEAVQPSQATNSATWYGENKLTNDIQAQIGVSIFLPFSWDYRLPK